MRSSRPNDPSPLCVAVQDENLDQVRHLLETGANPNENPRASLLTIALGGPNERLVRLLLEHGANPNNGGHPAWFIALNRDCSRFLPLLFKHGAKVNATGQLEETALHYWVETSYEEYQDGPPAPPLCMKAFKFLMEKGIDINAEDLFGDTALSIAQMKRYDLAARTIEAALLHRATPSLPRSSHSKRL